jgi:release factor glutamine methyltransferase
MTIGNAEQYISEKLCNIYEENEADNIAELLLENITANKRTERFLNKNKKLTDVQSQKINELLTRLLNHEPIQYILNECWFFGLKFYVDKNVLIPRPETEELVDWIIKNIKFPFKELKILDIGTGSGCIAVSLKRKLRKAELWACDISQAALNVAEKNSQDLQADINFIQLDFLNETERNKLPSFDIIVSNPPYVPEKDKAAMRKNVLNFEPHTALFVTENNALVFYETIADFSRQHLNKKGSIFCEIHESIGKDVKEIFLQKGFESEIKKDMQGKDRMIKSIITDH